MLSMIIHVYIYIYSMHLCKHIKHTKRERERERERDAWTGRSQGCGGLILGHRLSVGILTSHCTDCEIYNLRERFGIRLKSNRQGTRSINIDQAPSMCGANGSARRKA